MSLVGSHYRNLASPPSLESCTRDVYARQLVFSLGEALRIALDMASVAEQLHARGLMHGDFYAHNILVDDSGHALLGDFGAACFVSQSYAEQVFGLERIEVRAFRSEFDHGDQLQEDKTTLKPKQSFRVVRQN